MDTIDIGWLNLAIGIGTLLIPLAILYYYRTGMVKDTLISSGRMILQLLLVGFYLEFLFRLDMWWVNIVWLLAMIVIASFTMINRTGLRMKVFFIPNIIALVVTMLVIDTFFFLLVIQNDSVFEARYLIPISGMILGNAMQNSIISLNQFYSDIKDNPGLYRFSLGNGATLNEALLDYFRKGLERSLNPSVAKMAVIGLIALPGTMTGQIIGGSNPVTAIKYQILLMIVIFAASALSSWLCLLMSQNAAFDRAGNMKAGLFKKVQGKGKKR
jgi:putative ABC transport system permease protein